MNRSFLSIALVAIVFLLLHGSAEAQLQASLDSIDVSAYPTVSIRVVTKSGQLLKKDVDGTNFTVSEDGFVQQPVTFHGTHGSTMFGVGLLVGNGSYASTQDISQAKAIMLEVIDSLDGLNDEAGVMAYSSSLQVLESMKPLKMLLQNGVNALALNSSGSNRFWDGVYDALNEVAFNSVNPSRALFVMSNGRDDGSTRTMTEVVTLASNSHIKIYTLGLNASGGETNLQNLAERTGGQYFLSGIASAQTVVNALRGTPDYNVLEYTSNYQCRDGVPRAVSIKVKVGTDSTVAHGQYPVASDPNGNVQALFTVDTASGTAGRRVTVPILLKTDVANQRFTPSTIDLTYDKSKLTLVMTRIDSTYLPGVAATFAETASGARITTTGTAPLAGKGTTVLLVFMTSDVPQTTSVPVSITSLTFSAGCLVPQFAAGSVTILPKTFKIAAAGKPYSFTWDDTKKGYAPSSQTLVVDVTNTGDLTVHSLIGILPSVPEIVLLPGSAAQAAAPVDSLKPGEKTTLRWTVKPVPRADETSVQLDIPVSCADGAQVTARVYVNIKAATSAAAVSAIADTIHIVGGQYAPFPARITATVRSAGTAQLPSSQAGIVLPTGVTLATGSPVASIGALAPGASSQAEWTVEYPKNLSVNTDYPIGIIWSSAGYPSDTTWTALSVPVLNDAIITATKPAVPTTLRYDTVAKRYPDIIIRSTVRNAGNAASDTIRASLGIDPPLAFASGETSDKILASSLNPGDSVTVSWTLTVQDVACANRDADIRFAVWHNGIAINPTTSTVTIDARPNLKPEIVQRVPAALDTIAPGTSMTFRVQAVDPNGDVITYHWIVNGASEGGSTDTLRHTFTTAGTQRVDCVVGDFCSSTTVLVRWDFDVQVKTGVADVSSPFEFGILGSYPNPFNPGTTIEFRTPEGRHHVILDVLDAQGRVVAGLIDGTVEGGMHQAGFEASRFPSGVYTARLRVGTRTSTTRMMLVK